MIRTNDTDKCQGPTRHSLHPRVTTGSQLRPQLAPKYKNKKPKLPGTCHSRYQARPAHPRQSIVRMPETLRPWPCMTFCSLQSTQTRNHPSHVFSAHSKVRKENIGDGFTCWLQVKETMKYNARTATSGLLASLASMLTTYMCLCAKSIIEVWFAGRC